MQADKNPSVGSFLKGLVGIAVGLLLLHLVPYFATWIHLHFYGETLLIDSRRFRVVFFAAYILAGISVAINLAGLIYRAWRVRQARHGK
ncbi:hypothetical protein D3C86_1711260 [compost metagenome]